MKSVALSKVEIDAKGRLRLYPQDASYEFIYRAAAGVHWEKAGSFLHAGEPRDWTYPIQFGQAVAAVASEYGDSLEVGPDTEWVNVPAGLRSELEAFRWKPALFAQVEQGHQDIERAIVLASTAFHAGNYAEAKRLLDPFRDDAGLSPSAAKMLEMAVKRVK